MENLISKQPTAARWVQQLPSSSALLDKDHNLVDASTTWFSTFGFERKKVLGKPFSEFFPRYNDTWEDSFEYAKEGLSDIKIQDRFKNHEGIEQDFIWNINPWKDGYGKCVGIILNLKDISEKTALELQLKKTRKLLKEKSAIAKIGSWEYNISNHKMYWSKELKEIFNVPKKHTATLATSLAFFVKGQSRNMIKTLLKTAIEQGKPWNQNLQMTTANGEKIWVNTIGRPKFTNGKCVRIIGTLQNITDSYTPRPKTQEVAQQSPASYENLSIGIATIDLETGKITQVNSALTEELGLPCDTFLNQHFKSFLWLSREEQQQWLRSLIINGSFVGIEKEIFHDDLAQKVVYRLNGKLQSTAAGKKELIVSCQNITSYVLKQGTLETELALTHNELHRLTHFTHMLSHNLKGHASNFDLLLKFLSSEKDEKERESIVTVLSQSVENLTASIKDLRELVTIRHQVNEQKVSLKVNDIFYRTVQNNNGLIKQHKVKIHNEIPDDFIVNAIPVYFENIISNLLVNAIKFKNDNKQPIVYVDAEKNDKYCVVSIEDNGRGIDISNEKDKIFAFYQTLQNMDYSCGMGLYLAKYQIELMGGKISVESTPKTGSTFKIHFPLNS
ncbi:MAG: PAS domain-containing protein [Bacteroidota bacterium]